MRFGWEMELHHQVLGTCAVGQWAVVGCEERLGISLKLASTLLATCWCLSIPRYPDQAIVG